MSNIEEHKDLLAFHPGIYVKDLIEEYGLTQKEFANRSNLTEKNVSEIVNGKAPVTPETARKLANISGMSFQSWTNLQSSYDEKKKEIESEKELDAQKELLSLINYNKLAEKGLVPKARQATDKIRELCRLLKIADLRKLLEPDLVTSFRNFPGNPSDKHVINSNILVQIAFNKANETSSPQVFNKAKLEKCINSIRHYTMQPPEQIQRELFGRLAECGIQLVLVPSIPNGTVNGASRKLSNGGVLIMVNNRNKWSDIFWFTLLHEIGHVLDGDFGMDIDPDKEDAMDGFAREYFIPQADFLAFTEQYNFTKEAICDFAEKMQIHPGIVVGRLQKEEYIAFGQLNHLRAKYEIKGVI